MKRCQSSLIHLYGLGFHIYIQNCFGPLIWLRFLYVCTELFWLLVWYAVCMCVWFCSWFFFLVCLCMCGLSAPCDVDRFQSVWLVGSLLYDFVWSQSACYPPFCITIWLIWSSVCSVSHLYTRLVNSGPYWLWSYIMYNSCYWVIKKEM